MPGNISYVLSSASSFSKKSIRNTIRAVSLDPVFPFLLAQLIAKVISRRQLDTS